MSNHDLPEHLIVWNVCFGPYCQSAIDCDGRTIKKSDYGLDTAYGWEIDHVTPSALGGLDVYGNKRPRHQTGNRSAGGLLAGLLAKSPMNALHLPSYHIPLANALATLPPSPPRGLATLANALATPVSPPTAPFGGLPSLANALTERARTHDDPPMNALFTKLRGLF